jgi:hypothetical protein
MRYRPAAAIAGGAPAQQPAPSPLLRLAIASSISAPFKVRRMRSTIDSDMMMGPAAAESRGCGGEVEGTQQSGTTPC